LQRRHDLIGRRGRSERVDRTGQLALDQVADVRHRRQRLVHAGQVLRERAERLERLSPVDDIRQTRFDGVRFALEQRRRRGQQDALLE
jgi:hypothetical protein